FSGKTVMPRPVGASPTSSPTRAASGSPTTSSVTGFAPSATRYSADAPVNRRSTTDPVVQPSPAGTKRNPSGRTINVPRVAPVRIGPANGGKSGARINPPELAATASAVERPTNPATNGVAGRS